MSDLEILRNNVYNMPMVNGKKLRAVELFAGIGGFRIASEERGIETVWANDIDEIASTAYTNAFGKESYHKGDIWSLIDRTPPHDILTGGFPCQPFSSAGKKMGIEDPRGTLFEAIVRILKKHEPSYFVLENVKRLLVMDSGKHFATILAALSALDYRIEWRLLNTKDFGLPQNRQRVVIIGRHNRLSTNLNYSASEFLRLINETEFNMLSPKDVINFLDGSGWSDIPKHGKSFPNWGVAYRGQFFGRDIRIFDEAVKRVILEDVLEKEPDEMFDMTASTLKRLGGDTNTVREKFVGGVEILSNQAGGARMGYTIFGVNGLAPTLTSSTSRHYERYKIGEHYRRLTNVEYARIQGFPDNHCSAVGLRHQYVLYGNAVAPQLVGWAMDKLLLESTPKRLSLSNQLQKLSL